MAKRIIAYSWLIYFIFHVIIELRIITDSIESDDLTFLIGTLLENLKTFTFAFAASYVVIFGIYLVRKNGINKKYWWFQDFFSLVMKKGMTRLITSLQCVLNETFFWLDSCLPKSNLLFFALPKRVGLICRVFFHEGDSCLLDASSFINISQIVILLEITERLNKS